MTDEEEAAVRAVSEFQYPMWSIVELGQQPFPNGIVVFRPNTDISAVLVFGSLDMASRFIRKINGTTLTPCVLQEPQQLKDAIDYCKQRGASHVGANFDYQPDAATGNFELKGKGVFVPIHDFRLGL